MKKKNKAKSPLAAPPAATSVLAAVVCVIIGLAVGFIILLIIDVDSAWSDGLSRILKGGFYMSPIGIGREIASAAPLIMTGLSVAFAFKTGIFNIGVAGQYTVGAFGAIFCAIVLKMPWWACLLGASVFGALWGMIPGIFKVTLNINEVLTSIMFNWIGLYAVNTLMYGSGTSVMYNAMTTKTWTILSKNADGAIPDMGLAQFFSNKSTTIAIFLAMIVAIIIYVILDKTTFGYELKACGFNKNAAKYAGINEKKNIVLSMMISGALAGFGAGLYYLSGAGEWSPQDSTSLPGVGWNGISVALLASSNPIGCIFSALLISHITTGGSFMTAMIYPPEIADIVTGVIVYLCAFSMLFKEKIISLLFRKVKKAEIESAALPDADEPDESIPPPGGTGEPPNTAESEAAPDADMAEEGGPAEKWSDSEEAPPNEDGGEGDEK